MSFRSAMAMLRLRRSMHAVTCRRLNLLTLQPMHTLRYVKDEISLEVFSDQLYKNLNSKLYKASLSFCGVSMDVGAYKFNWSIPEHCYFAQKLKLPEVMKFQYIYQGMDVLRQTESIIAYDILGIPLHHIMFKSNPLDSRMLHVIRMIIDLIFKLKEKLVVNVLDEHNIFLVNEKEIRIVIISAHDDTNDFLRLASWLWEAYTDNRGQDEFDHFVYVLSQDFFKMNINYHHHSFLWSLEMKERFIRNLHHKLSNRSCRNKFDKMSCYWFPWNQKMDQLLFKFMLVKQWSTNRSNANAYNVNKCNDLIHLIRNLLEHGGGYPSICMEACGVTFKEQEKYFRSCFPMLFIILINRVTELEWVDLIPPF